MRIVLQRVASARVTVDGATVGEIGAGLLLLVAAAEDDTAAIAAALARKCAGLRIFPAADADNARFDRSLLDTGGAALVVSQFTLLADTRRGRRPSFVAAARPELAAPLLDAFAAALGDLGVAVQTGTFGAHMLVESTNDGPVTIILDSEDLARPRRAHSGE